MRPTEISSSKTGLKPQISETFALGAILAAAGGYLDAYTYLARGHVFANAQTGNIVLLGINLAEGRIDNIIYYLLPVLAFILGVLAAEVIRNRFKEHPNIHWRQVILAAEILILAGVAFLPQGNYNTLANVAISFICSMQVEGFRKIHGSVYATTMCTGNLRSATEFLYRFTQTRDSEESHKSLQFYGIIGFFILGAAIGTFLTKVYSIKAVLFCCLLLAAAFAAMFIRRDDTAI